MRFDTDAQTRLAVADLWQGIANRQLWGVLAWQDIRQRYRRSTLGPFWLTLSMGATIFALGFVYSAIFKMSLREYFPFLAIGMVAWALLSGLITDGCQTFISNDATIKQIRLPFTAYVMRVVWRNYIIFAHNAVIIVIVLLLFGRWPGAPVLYVIPGLVVMALSGGWVALLLGTICARFRDIPPIIQSVMQLVFFVTPILWHPSVMPGQHRLIAWNPFYHFVELLRAPLLGQAPGKLTWLVAVGITLVGWGLAFIFHRRYRRRIAYWV